MTIELTKDSVDLGIIVSDADAALRFYRDTLGLAMVGQDPVAFGGTMYRLMCGSSMIKLLHLDKEPPAKAPPGGIPGGFGYRYWTISVSNLEEITAAVEAAGYKIAVPVREIRPGVSISMVEDPDGNWVEFLRIS
jgi:catechol 2,3-dioxygenase-like lactoylglutathione lyase family enzyme